jgi:hypothetical protein
MPFSFFGSLRAGRFDSEASADRCSGVSGATRAVSASVSALSLAARSATRSGLTAGFVAGASLIDL